MNWLIQWVESGNAITLTVGVIAAEILILAMWRGKRAATVILGLVPGLCLMLALRAAIIGQGAEWIGMWLTASLPAHVLDLRLRLKEGGAS